MFNWGDLIGACAMVAAIAYFIGWMNGCNDGMEEERKRNWEAYKKEQEQNIYFL